MIFFQGGGACWDEFTTYSGFCDTEAKPQALVGVFDRQNPANKFRNFTIVHVLYCSGDVHAGNTVRPYNDFQGNPVLQVGQVNVESVLSWIDAQISSGGLSSEFEELVIFGCSAGSLAAQVWGPEILSRYTWNSAAIVPDSFAGVAPEDTIGNVLFNYGFCETRLVPESLVARCRQRRITLPEIALAKMSEVPVVPFTFIQSKADQIQRAYYSTLVTTTESSMDAFVTTYGFYEMVNDLFGRYNAERPNFLVYLVDGSQHCFAQLEVVYRTDPNGVQPTSQNLGTPSLISWLNQLPLQSDEAISTVCSGPTESYFFVDYCAPEVIPKQFTAS